MDYSCEKKIEVQAFIDLLERSTLGARRPLEDRVCLQAMLEHAGILCTAWDGELLVGLARSVTDFSYCCYLSDLAVDVNYQSQGIGKELIRRTQEKLGPRATLILLAAPAAVEYYPHIGFEAHHSAWVLPANRDLS